MSNNESRRKDKLDDNYYDVHSKDEAFFRRRHTTCAAPVRHATRRRRRRQKPTSEGLTILPRNVLKRALNYILLRPFDCDELAYQTYRRNPILDARRARPRTENKCEVMYPSNVYNNARATLWQMTRSQHNI